MKSKLAGWPAAAMLVWAGSAFAGNAVYTPEQGPAGTPGLVAKWAPVLVQLLPERPVHYDLKEDHLGRPHPVRAGDGQIHVRVETDDPVVYWYEETKPIGDHVRRQITYAAWYPSRPGQWALDLDRGEVDGISLRLTLDERDRPLLFEVIQNCGCGHQLWVEHGLHQAAKAEFTASQPKNLQGKVSPLVKKESSYYYFNLREPDVTLPEAAEFRPVVTVLDGVHLASRVEALAEAPQGSETRAYRLEPYENLLTLPLEGRPVGIFTPEGLVYAACRPGCKFYSTMGMWHAGHPKRRDVQDIIHETVRFEAPGLFEKYLNLPASFLH